MSVTKPRFTLEFEKPIRELEDKIAALRASSESAGMDVTKEAVSMEAKLAQTRREVYGNLNPWQRVQLARHPRRPYSLDYIGMIFDDFQELHGDRLYIDVLGEVSLRRNLAFFFNLRNVHDQTERIVISGPQTPASARFRQSTDFGALWTFGIKGSF